MPVTPYQISKREGELTSIKYFKLYNMPIIILRILMIFGKNSLGSFNIIKKIAKYGLFIKIGFKNNLIPALYINDLLKCILKVIYKGKIGEIYLLTSTRSYSENELFNIFSKFYNKKKSKNLFTNIFNNNISENTKKIFLLFKREPKITVLNIKSLTHNRIFNIGKIVKDINYKPSYNLEKNLINSLKC